MTAPTGFDLESGRLCVMASRHRSGLLIVSRNHVGATLDALVPSASQPLGQPDALAQGIARHQMFWRYLDQTDRPEG